MNLYLTQVADLSYEFIGLVAEALGLPRDGLDQFYDAHEKMQHRAKVCVLVDTRIDYFISSVYKTSQIVKYPTLDEVSSDQGVGPHFDGGFLTFVRCSMIYYPRSLT